MQIPSYECGPGEHYYEPVEVDMEASMKTIYLYCVACGDYISRYLNPAPLPSQITEAFQDQPE
jgi:hypothetical protein